MSEESTAHIIMYLVRIGFGFVLFLLVLGLGLDVIKGIINFIGIVIEWIANTKVGIIAIVGFFAWLIMWAFVPLFIK